MNSNRRQEARGLVARHTDDTPFVVDKNGNGYIALIPLFNNAIATLTAAENLIRRQATRWTQRKARTQLTGEPPRLGQSETAFEMALLLSTEAVAVGRAMAWLGVQQDTHNAMVLRRTFHEIEAKVIVVLQGTTAPAAIAKDIQDWFGKTESNPRRGRRLRNQAGRSIATVLTEGRPSKEMARITHELQTAAQLRGQVDDEFAHPRYTIARELLGAGEDTLQSDRTPTHIIADELEEICSTTFNILRTVMMAATIGRDTEAEQRAREELQKHNCICTTCEGSKIQLRLQARRGRPWDHNTREGAKKNTGSRRTASLWQLEIATLQQLYNRIANAKSWHWEREHGPASEPAFATQTRFGMVFLLGGELLYRLKGTAKLLERGEHAGAQVLFRSVSETILRGLAVLKGEWETGEINRIVKEYFDLPSVRQRHKGGGVIRRRLHEAIERGNCDSIIPREQRDAIRRELEEEDAYVHGDMEACQALYGYDPPQIYIGRTRASDAVRLETRYCQRLRCSRELLEALAREVEADRSDEQWYFPAVCTCGQCRGTWRE